MVVSVWLSLRQDVHFTMEGFRVLVADGSPWHPLRGGNFPLTSISTTQADTIDQTPHYETCNPNTKKCIIHLVPHSLTLWWMLFASFFKSTFLDSQILWHVQQHYLPSHNLVSSAIPIPYSNHQAVSPLSLNKVRWLMFYVPWCYHHAIPWHVTQNELTIPTYWDLLPSINIDVLLNENSKSSLKQGIGRVVLLCIIVVVWMYTFVGQFPVKIL